MHVECYEKTVMGRRSDEPDSEQAFIDRFCFDLFEAVAEMLTFAAILIVFPLIWIGAWSNIARYAIPFFVIIGLLWVIVIVGLLTSSGGESEEDD